MNNNHDSLTMITILSGTNRANNKSVKIAELYLEHYHSGGVAAQLLDLQNLPADFSSTWMRDKQSTEFQNQVEKYVRNVDKILMVVPEYQGTFPGILKMFFDAIHPKDLAGKKVALTGSAAGRGGNLRGMDHLASTFHYLGIHVYPALLPISKINDLMTQEGILHDEATLKSIRDHADGFVRY